MMRDLVFTYHGSRFTELVEDWIWQQRLLLRQEVW